MVITHNAKIWLRIKLLEQKSQVRESKKKFKEEKDIYIQDKGFRETV